MRRPDKLKWSFSLGGFLCLVVTMLALSTSGPASELTSLTAEEADVSDYVSEPFHDYEMAYWTLDSTGSLFIEATLPSELSTSSAQVSVEYSVGLGPYEYTWSDEPVEISPGATVALEVQVPAAAYLCDEAASNYAGLKAAVAIDTHRGVLPPAYVIWTDVGGSQVEFFTALPADQGIDPDSMDTTVAEAVRAQMADGWRVMPAVYGVGRRGSGDTGLSFEESESSTYQEGY